MADTSPHPDPLNTTAGSVAMQMMHLLELGGWGHVPVVLIVLDPLDGCVAIESGGFNDPDAARALVKLAADGMGHPPLDVTDVPHG